LFLSKNKSSQRYNHKYQWYTSLSFFNIIPLKQTKKLKTKRGDMELLMAIMQKISRSFASHMEESMAGHVGIMEFIKS
jgi:hypothetical protein